MRTDVTVACSSWNLTGDPISLRPALSHYFGFSVFSLLFPHHYFFVVHRNMTVPRSSLIMMQWINQVKFLTCVSIHP